MVYPVGFTFRGFDNYISRSMQLRVIEACGSLRYRHEFQITMAGSADEFLNRIAVLPGWTIYRIYEHKVIAFSSSAVMEVVAHSGRLFVDCNVLIWAADTAAGNEALENIKEQVEAFRRKSSGDAQKFIAHWVYQNNRGYSTAKLTELVSENLHSSAYPWLPKKLDDFVENYLSSDELILVLHGMPGAGKTRLIRHMLATMSQINGEPVTVLYTTEERAFHSDELFVQFMTGNYDAMVIEDADHLLLPRSDGNQHLHRFLAASDGLLQASGRRLIFSSNLPSKLDIDEALIRPGRCFGCFSARKLTAPEAESLLADLVPESTHQALACQHLKDSGQTGFSLAEVYAAVREIRRQNHGQELSSFAGHTAVDPPAPQGEQCRYSSAVDGLGV